MRWFKRDMWRVGITLAGLLFFLVLMVLIPMSANAYEGASGLATPVAETVTPTVDATVAALQKEKLQHDNDWFWNYGATLLSTIALFIAGIFALVRWFADRQAERKKQEASEIHLLEDRQAEREKRDEEQKRWLEDRQAEREKRDEELNRWMEDRQAEREKRAEERFQSVIEGLGSTSRSAQVGAAIMLRTFLRPGYEQFYSQAFDLSVAHLRLRNVDPDKPEPLDSLVQALITVFKEAFPRARNKLKRNTQFFDATGIQLDNAYLSEADLKQVWMRDSYLRNADLSEAELTKANLTGANLTGANLHSAKLEEADLWGARLEGADLSWAKLNGAYLNEAKLSGAKLTLAHLSGAHIVLADLSKAQLEGADFTEADLRRADMIGANLLSARLTGADLEGALFTGAKLRGANPEKARSLKNTNFFLVDGLTKEQLAACKAKGAFIYDEDDDAMESSLEPTVSPLPDSEDNDARPPSALLVQENALPPSTDGSSGTCSQPSAEP